MDIHMTVNGMGSSFDEVDIRESGQSIGEAIGDSIDVELEDPKCRTIVITITV